MSGVRAVRLVRKGVDANLFPDLHAALYNEDAIIH